ncbi:MAG: hypothetical protein Q8Q39_00165 [bacterium]|nr:hypothetical protein [bacterium]
MVFSKLFFLLLAAFIVIPVSLVCLGRLLRWIMIDLLEFRFIPFRWREGAGFALLALPAVVAIVLWLAFWIALIMRYWKAIVAYVG